MSRFFANTVASVVKPPTLVLLLPESQASWCQQLSEEGYNVILVPYPSQADALQNSFSDIRGSARLENDTEWALVTFGLESADLAFAGDLLSSGKLKACAHYCPQIEDGKGLVHELTTGTTLPTIFHLSAKQEALHASLQEIAEKAVGIPTSRPPPVTIYTYPFVSTSPLFPFEAGPPIDHASGKVSSIAPYLRSANNLSYTRTLALLRRELGPNFPFEKLWERHTYFEFEERDAPKTMATMVSTPYVNHVPTMTGGVGYQDLARFYKYHFVRENITPPDTELITISRTIGADRVIDEMIFKCTHTTEIDYFLPGIKPTGKPLEIALVGVVAFRGDKLTFEHIYWDQASVLVQLGLLEPGKLPVAGVEVARKVVDPFGQPSNRLLTRWKESEGLPID
ncbi:NTF2-like protein [Lentinus tigrinus ALCF2SS1-6]|uniref:NTF2-like protein n=1 Tax=Lentinus tigrinus ALCF2SS1-6 TaxID=1328759 RepID=A0A5C2SLX4_9APHY|nr:NTF2-like protein [Lentinus tigrinus ALCF2SS1-6]